MADVPKFPGFPGQPGDAWAFIKNIPSFLGGEDAEVDTSMLPFDLGDKRLIESNEPFMPPDLTTVDPTDKYSQLERDWQNLQKIPEGTRDIFNRIVSEGEPSNIWPVQELFPHIEPRSSNPIRSPFPPTNTTPTTRRMVRALNPNPLKVDVPDPRRIAPRFTPRIRGGPWGLLASSLIGGEAHAPTVTQMYDYGVGSADPMHMKPVYFTDRDSPFSWRNPGEAAFSSPPQSLVDRHRDMWSNFQNLRDQNRKAVVEDPARQAIEENRLNTLQGFGLLPFTRSGALTPQELFKQRNDAEELRIREGSLPVIPEVPEWNPQASIPPDFRVNERSMAALSPGVTYTPPPVVPPVSREQEIENMMIRDRMENLKYLPGHPLYEAPFEAGTGPMAEAIIPRVETFAEPRTAWTPPAPVIPDIVVPPPAAAPTPYVEQFEEITPPRRVERRKPSQRAPKVVKKKATKAKPKPRRVKQTAVQKALAKPAPRRVKYTPPKPKPAPRRVKYTPPKPKSKTPVTRRKGGKPKVRRVSKAPRRPGGR